MTREPCRSCPWRKDQDASDIPAFRLELAEALAATCPDDRGMGPEFGAPQFACHQSRPGEEIVCAGWLAQAGLAHPMVRLGIAQGDVAREAVVPRDDLEPDYQHVIEKLRATA